MVFARKLSAAAVAVFLALAISAPLLAQTPPPPPPSPAPPSRQPAPGRTPSQPAPRLPRELDRRMVFLAGNVVMSDGTIPKERVSIERVCQGNARREGYTDANGYFSLSIGNAQDGVYQDASSSFPGSGGPLRPDLRGVTESDLVHCELRASLSGHRSSTISLAGRRVMDRPEVGTLVLFPHERQTGTLVSVAALKVPRSARRHFERGTKASEKQKWDEAQSDLERALQEHPEYPDALFELGLLYHRQGRTDEARKAYLEAIELDPKFIKPQFYMVQLATEQERWVEAVNYADRLVELDPITYPSVHYHSALANYALGHMDAAEKSARQAELMLPMDLEPRVALLLGSILFVKRDYQGAIEGFQTYLKFAPNASNAATVRANLEKLQKHVADNPAPPAAAPPPAPKD